MQENGELFSVISVDPQIPLFKSELGSQDKDRSSRLKRINQFYHFLPIVYGPYNNIRPVYNHRIHSIRSVNIFFTSRIRPYKRYTTRIRMVKNGKNLFNLLERSNK